MLRVYSQISYAHVWGALNESHRLLPSNKLFVDAIVVGSGCGGGVMAHELVQAGYSVLVLEKGGYYQAEDFAQWTESEAMAKCFEKGGLCTSADNNILFLAGSCVGGGSSVNWSASFRTPDFVLQDWAQQGLSAFGKSGRYQQSMETILKLLKVNTDHSYHSSQCPPSSGCSFHVNENNRMLWESAEKCGWRPEKIPRNVQGCKDCGHCCFGCSHDAKQSTIKSLLEPQLLRQQASATRGKLFVIPDCKVHTILTESNGQGGKKAVGVRATATVYQEEGLDRIPVSTQ